MPDDEPFEYLPTQAIADFLATEATPPLDGIIFPSVQVGGEALNIALFHKAARVEEIEVPRGTEVSVFLNMYEEGSQREYTVIEEVPREDDDLEKKVSKKDFDGRWDLDERPFTLKIDLDSLRVHVVEAVSFKTDEHKVRRHRWEKQDPGFSARRSRR
jgi:RES domain